MKRNESFCYDRRCRGRCTCDAIKKKRELQCEHEEKRGGKSWAFISKEKKVRERERGKGCGVEKHAYRQWP
jgi:hypothetical protein